MRRNGDGEIGCLLSSLKKLAYSNAPACHLPAGRGRDCGFTPLEIMPRWNF